MPGRPRPLADFAPYWLPVERGSKREKMGLGFLCPIHRDHPVVFYFRHPLDGEAAQPLTPLVEVEDYLDSYDGTESFGEITMYYRDGDIGPLVAPCGAQFWVIGGEVLTRPKRRPRG